MPTVEEETLAELREIKKLLTPTSMPPSPPSPKGMWQEFKLFLSQYKILGLAVAFILGVYLGGLVKAFVTDLLLPLVSLLIPGLNINTFMVGPFAVGDFVNASITFIAVAFVVFLIVKVAKRYSIE